MAKALKIRIASRDEIYAVAKFLHEVWQTEYQNIVADDYLDTMSVNERHTGLLDKYDEGVWEFFAMQDDDRIVGASVFGKSFVEGFPDDGEIAAIYLHSDYIGKGYGHRLFAEIERALTQKGYTRFILDVLSNNKRALGFYLAHGYSIVAERQVRLGESDYPLTILRK